MAVWLVGALTLAGGSGCGTDADNGYLASGQIQVDDIQVASKMPGQIMHMAAREGESVNRGDTLAVIDHRQLTLKRKEAEARVAVARSELKLLQAGAQREDIKQAKAQLKQAEAELLQARRNLKRVQALYQEGTETEKELEEMQTRVTVAKAGYEIADARLERLQHRPREEERDVARAQLERARRAVAIVRSRIQDAYVLAPADGVLLEEVMQPGEMTREGGTLYTLADLDQVYLRIYLPEPDLADVGLGDTVYVYPDGMGNAPVRGRVSFIASEAEFTPQNVQTKHERMQLVFRVKISLPNPEHRVKPGMYADVYLEPTSSSN